MLSDTVRQNIGRKLKRQSISIEGYSDPQEINSGSPSTEHEISEQYNDASNASSELDILKDRYKRQNRHHETIRHLCRASLLKLKERNVNLISLGEFCHLEFMFVDVVYFMCNQSFKRLDLKSIIEAFRTINLMTKMFLEFGVEDDRMNENWQGNTMTQMVLGQLHKYKWLPMDIDPQTDKTHFTIVKLISEHLRSLLAYGFLDPNTISSDILFDIHPALQGFADQCISLRSSEQCDPSGVKFRELRQELEQATQNKDESKIKRLKHIIPDNAISMEEACRAQLCRDTKREKKCLPVEVSLMDISQERKQYISLGIQPVRPLSTNSKSIIKKPKRIRNHQNTSESRPKKQKMETDSNNQKIKEGTSNQNTIHDHYQNIKELLEQDYDLEIKNLFQ